MDPQVLADLLETFGADGRQSGLPWNVDQDAAALDGFGVGLRFEANGREWRVSQVDLTEDEANASPYRGESQLRDAARVLPPVCYAPLVSQYTRLLRDPRWEVKVVPAIMSAMLHDPVLFHLMDSNPLAPLSDYRVSAMTRWWAVMAKPVLRYENNCGRPLLTLMGREESAETDTVAAGDVADARMPMPDMQKGYRDIKTVLTLIAATSAPYRCSRPPNAAVSGCTARLVFCKDPSTVYLGLLLNTVLRDLPRKVQCSMPVFRLIAEGWGNTPSLQDILRAAWEEYRDVVTDIRRLVNEHAAACTTPPNDTAAASTLASAPRPRRSLPQLRLPTHAVGDSDSSSSSSTSATAGSRAPQSRPLLALGNPGQPVGLGIPLEQRAARAPHIDFDPTRPAPAAITAQSFVSHVDAVLNSISMSLRGRAQGGAASGPGHSHLLTPQQQQQQQQSQPQPARGSDGRTGEEARPAGGDHNSAYKTEDASRICLESMKECAESPELLLWWARCRLLAYQLLDNPSRTSVDSTRALDFFRQLWSCAPLAREILEDDQEAWLKASLLDSLFPSAPSASTAASPEDERALNEEAATTRARHVDDDDGTSATTTTAAATAAAVEGRRTRLAELQEQARRLYASLVGTIADLSKFWFSIRVVQSTVNTVASIAPENNIIWSIVNATVPSRLRFQREEFSSYAEHWQYALLVDDYVTQPMGFRVSTRGRTMVTQLLHVLTEYPTFYPALVTRTLALLNRREMIVAELNGRLVAAVARCLRFYLPPMPPVLAVPAKATAATTAAAAGATAGSPEPTIGDASAGADETTGLPRARPPPEDNEEAQEPSSSHSTFSTPSEHVNGNGSTSPRHPSSSQDEDEAHPTSAATGATTAATAVAGGNNANEEAEGSTSGMNYEAYVMSDSEDESDGPGSADGSATSHANNNNNNNNSEPAAAERHPRLRRRAARRAAAARLDALRRQQEAAMPVLTTKAYDAILTCLDVLRMLVRNAHLSVNPMGILFAAPAAAAAATADAGMNDAPAAASAESRDAVSTTVQAPSPSSREGASDTTAAEARAHGHSHRELRLQPSLPKPQCDLFTLLHQLVHQTRYGPLAAAALRLFSACVHFNVRDMVPLFTELGLLNTVLVIARRRWPAASYQQPSSTLCTAVEGGSASAGNDPSTTTVEPDCRITPSRNGVSSSSPSSRAAETAEPRLVFALDMLEETGLPNVQRRDVHVSQLPSPPPDAARDTPTTNGLTAGPLVTERPPPSLLVRYIPNEDAYANHACIRLVLPEFVEAMTVHQATHGVFRKRRQWISAVLQTLTVAPALNTAALTDISTLWEDEEKKQLGRAAATEKEAAADRNRPEEEEEEKGNQVDEVRRQRNHLVCRGSPAYNTLLRLLLASRAPVRGADDGIAAPPAADSPPNPSNSASATSAPSAPPPQSASALTSSSTVDACLVRLAELCRLHLKREEASYKTLQISARDMSRVLTEVLQPFDIFKEAFRPALQHELAQLGRNVRQFTQSVRRAALGRSRPFLASSYTGTATGTATPSQSNPATHEVTVHRNEEDSENSDSGEADANPHTDDAPHTKPLLPASRMEAMLLLVRATELCRTFNNFFALFSAMDWTGQRRGPRLTRHNLERQEGVQRMIEVLHGTVESFHKVLEELWGLMGCQVPLTVQGSSMRLLEQGIPDGESSLMSYVQVVVAQCLYPRLFGDYLRNTQPSSTLEGLLRGTVMSVLYYSTRGLYYLHSPKDDAEAAEEEEEGGIMETRARYARRLQRRHSNAVFRGQELVRLLQGDTASPSSAAPTAGSGSAAATSRHGPIRLTFLGATEESILNVPRPLSMGDGVFLRQLFEAWRYTTANNNGSSGNSAGAFGGVVNALQRRDGEAQRWRVLFGDLLQCMVDTMVVQAPLNAAEVPGLLRSLRGGSGSGSGGSSAHAAVSSSLLSLYDRSTEAGAAVSDTPAPAISASSAAAAAGAEATTSAPALHTPVSAAGIAPTAAAGPFGLPASPHATAGDQLMQSLLQDSRNYVSDPSIAWMTADAWREATTGASSSGTTLLSDAGTASASPTSGAATAHTVPLGGSVRNTAAAAATSASSPAPTSTVAAGAGRAQTFPTSSQFASAFVLDDAAAVPASGLEEVAVEVREADRMANSRGSLVSSASSSSSIITPTLQRTPAGVPVQLSDVGVAVTSGDSTAASAAHYDAARSTLHNAAGAAGAGDSGGAATGATAAVASTDAAFVAAAAAVAGPATPPLFSPVNPAKALQQWTFMSLFNGRRSALEQAIPNIAFSVFRRDSRVRAVLPLNIAALVRGLHGELTTAFDDAVRGVFADAVTMEQCRRTTADLRESEPENYGRALDEIVAARRAQRALARAEARQPDGGSSGSTALPGALDPFASCPWFDFKPRQLVSMRLPVIRNVEACLADIDFAAVHRVLWTLAVLDAVSAGNNSNNNGGLSSAQEVDPHELSRTLSYAAQMLILLSRLFLGTGATTTLDRPFRASDSDAERARKAAAAAAASRAVAATQGELRRCLVYMGVLLMNYLEGSDSRARGQHQVVVEALLYCVLDVWPRLPGFPMLPHMYVSAVELMSQLKSDTVGCIRLSKLITYARRAQAASETQEKEEEVEVSAAAAAAEADENSEEGEEAADVRGALRRPDPFSDPFPNPEISAWLDERRRLMDEELHRFHQSAAYSAANTSTQAPLQRRAGRAADAPMDMVNLHTDNRWATQSNHMWEAAALRGRSARDGSSSDAERQARLLARLTPTAAAAARARAHFPTVHLWERALPWLCDIVTGGVFPLSALSETGHRLMRKRACKFLWTLWTATKAPEQPHLLAYMLDRVLSDTQRNVVLLEYMGVLLSQLRSVVLIEALALTKLPAVIVAAVKKVIAEVTAAQEVWERQAAEEKSRAANTAEAQGTLREQRRRRRRAFAAQHETLHGQLVNFLSLFQNCRSDAPLVTDRFTRNSAAQQHVQAMATQCNYYDATRNTFCWNGHQCHRHHVVPVNGQRGRDGEEVRFSLNSFGTGTQRMLDEVLTVLDSHGYGSVHSTTTEEAPRSTNPSPANAPASAAAEGATATANAPATRAAGGGDGDGIAPRRASRSSSEDSTTAAARNPSASPTEPVIMYDHPTPEPFASLGNGAPFPHHADAAEDDDATSPVRLVRHERLTPHGFVTILEGTERQLEEHRAAASAAGARRFTPRPSTDDAREDGPGTEAARTSPWGGPRVAHVSSPPRPQRQRGGDGVGSGEWHHLHRNRWADAASNANAATTAAASSQERAAPGGGRERGPLRHRLQNPLDAQRGGGADPLRRAIIPYCALFSREICEDVLRLCLDFMAARLRDERVQKEEAAEEAQWAAKDQQQQQREQHQPPQQEQQSALTGDALAPSDGAAEGRGSALDSNVIVDVVHGGAVPPSGTSSGVASPLTPVPPLLPSAAPAPQPNAGTDGSGQQRDAGAAAAAAAAMSAVARIAARLPLPRVEVVECPVGEVMIHFLLSCFFSYYKECMHVVHHYTPANMIATSPDHLTDDTKEKNEEEKSKVDDAPRCSADTTTSSSSALSVLCGYITSIDLPSREKTVVLSELLLTDMPRIEDDIWRDMTCVLATAVHVHRKASRLTDKSFAALRTSHERRRHAAAEHPKTRTTTSASTTAHAAAAGSPASPELSSGATASSGGGAAAAAAAAVARRKPSTATHDAHPSRRRPASPPAKTAASPAADAAPSTGLTAKEVEAAEAAADVHHYVVPIGIFLANLEPYIARQPTAFYYAFQRYCTACWVKGGEGEVPAAWLGIWVQPRPLSHTAGTSDSVAVGESSPTRTSRAARRTRTAAAAQSSPAASLTAPPSREFTERVSCFMQHLARNVEAGFGRASHGAGVLAAVEQLPGVCAALLSPSMALPVPAVYASILTTTADTAAEAQAGSRIVVPSFLALMLYFCGTLSEADRSNANHFAVGVDFAAGLLASNPAVVADAVMRTMERLVVALEQMKDAAAEEDESPAQSSGEANPELRRRTLTRCLHDILCFLERGSPRPATAALPARQRATQQLTGSNAVQEAFLRFYHHLGEQGLLPLLFRVCRLQTCEHGRDATSLLQLLHHQLLALGEYKMATMLVPAQQTYAAQQQALSATQASRNRIGAALPPSAAYAPLRMQTGGFGQRPLNGGQLADALFGIASNEDQTPSSLMLGGAEVVDLPLLPINHQLIVDGMASEEEEEDESFESRDDAVPVIMPQYEDEEHEEEEEEEEEEEGEEEEESDELTSGSDGPSSTFFTPMVVSGGVAAEDGDGDSDAPAEEMWAPMQPVRRPLRHVRIPSPHHHHHLNSHPHTDEQAQNVEYVIDGSGHLNAIVSAASDNPREGSRNVNSHEENEEASAAGGDVVHSDGDVADTQHRGDRPSSSDGAYNDAEWEDYTSMDASATNAAEGHDNDADPHHHDDEERSDHHAAAAAAAAGPSPATPQHRDPAELPEGAEWITLPGGVTILYNPQAQAAIDGDGDGADGAHDAEEEEEAEDEEGEEAAEEEEEEAEDDYMPDMSSDGGEDDDDDGGSSASGDELLTQMMTELSGHRHRNHHHMLGGANVGGNGTGNGSNVERAQTFAACAYHAILQAVRPLQKHNVVETEGPLLPVLHATEEEEATHGDDAPPSASATPAATTTAGANNGAGAHAEGGSRVLPLHPSPPRPLPVAPSLSPLSVRDTTPSEQRMHRSPDDGSPAVTHTSPPEEAPREQPTGTETAAAAARNDGDDLDGLSLAEAVTNAHEESEPTPTPTPVAAAAAAAVPSATPTATVATSTNAAEGESGVDDITARILALFAAGSNNNNNTHSNSAASADVGAPAVAAPEAAAPPAAAAVPAEPTEPEPWVGVVDVQFLTEMPEDVRSEILFDSMQALRGPEEREVLGQRTRLYPGLLHAMPTDVQRHAMEVEARWVRVTRADDSASELYQTIMSVDAETRRDLLLQCDLDLLGGYPDILREATELRAEVERHRQELEEAERAHAARMQQQREMAAEEARNRRSARRWMLHGPNAVPDDEQMAAAAAAGVRASAPVVREMETVEGVMSTLYGATSIMYAVVNHELFLARRLYRCEAVLQNLSVPANTLGGGGWRLPGGAAAREGVGPAWVTSPLLEDAEFGAARLRHGRGRGGNAQRRIPPTAVTALPVPAVHAALPSSPYNVSADQPANTPPAAAAAVASPLSPAEWREAGEAEEEVGPLSGEGSGSRAVVTGGDTSNEDAPSPPPVPAALAALSESMVPVPESPYHPLSLPLPEVPDDVVFSCLKLLRLRSTAALSLPYNATAGISCLDQQLQHLLQLLMGNRIAAVRLVCHFLDVMANTPTTTEELTEATPATAAAPAPTANVIFLNQVFIKGATAFLVSLLKQNHAMVAGFFLLPDGAIDAATLKATDAPMDATERHFAEYGLWNRLWKVCRQHVHVQGFLYSLDQLLRQLLRSQKMFDTAEGDNEVRSPDDPLADEPLSESLILHPRHPHRLRWSNIRRLSNYEEGGYVCNVCGVNPGYDYCFHCSSCQFDLCPSCSRERLSLAQMQTRISRSSALLLMAVPETVTSMTAFLKHPLCRPNIAASVVQLMTRGLQECAALEAASSASSPLSASLASAAGAATSIPSLTYTASNSRGPAHASFSAAGPLQILEQELVQMAEARVRAMKDARDSFRLEVNAILSRSKQPPPTSTSQSVVSRSGAAVARTGSTTTTTSNTGAPMLSHGVRAYLSIPDGYIFDTDTAMALLVKLDIKDGEGDAIQRLFEPYVATTGAEPRAFTMLWRASQAYLHDVSTLLEHLTPQEVLPLPSCVSTILQTFCRYHLGDGHAQRGGSSSARTLTGSRSNLAGETEHFLRASTKPSSVSDRAVKELSEQEDAAQWTTAAGTRLSDEGLRVAEEQQRRLPHVVRALLEENRVTLNTILHWDGNLLKENFSFLKYEPNLIDFNFKLSDFRRRLTQRKGSNILLRVKRDNCLLDSFKELQKQKSLGGQLHVRFEGEEGADAGGLTREWLQLLSEALVDERYALFVHSQDSASFQPNPFSSVNPNHLDYFQFAGVVVALAIAHNVPIDIHFTRAFYRHIIGHRPVFADLQSFDQELYTNLNWIMENDVTNLALTFAVNYNRFGSVEEEELEPNGKNTAVTNANKQQYVRLLCEFHMTKRTEEQLLRFLKGFYSVIPRREIQCFTENELELVISGMPDIDVEDLRTHTVYEGYSSTSPQIRWFWDAVNAMTKEDLANLLQFTTGSSKVPHGGFGHLEGSNGRSLPFTISRWAVSKDDLLPQAHTCFNKIDLPVYTSAAVLKEKLMLAITYGSMGFTMV